MMLRSAVTTVVVAGLAVPAAAGCALSKAFARADEHGTTTVQVFETAPDPAIRNARAVLFVSPLKVNTDGTSRSYNMHDPRALTLAINDMRNAMPRGRTIAEFEAVAAAGWPLPRTWQVVSSSVIEKDRTTGRPCVDAKGFMVSTTSDVAVDGGFARVGDCRQDKWIDALKIPALVLPKPSHGPTEFDTRGALTRSPVIAMTLGPDRAISLGIVGDHGPVDELGEASVAMNRQLRGLPETDEPANNRDANSRFQGPRSIIVIFAGPGARLARPITPATVRARVSAMFEAWGGTAKLEQCSAAIERL